MAFRDHFSDVAERYRDARPSYPDALIDYISALAPHREHVWDCGTGTGQVARALSSRFDRVSASDASDAQIAHAEGPPNVHYFVAPAEQSGLEAQSVDLICAGAAAHWFDHERFSAEVRRVAKPGAAVALFSYGAGLTLGHPELDAFILHFANVEIDAHWPERIAHVRAAYRTLPFSFVECEVPAFSISLPPTLDTALSFARTWSATQRAETAAPGTFARFADAFSALWTDIERRGEAPETFSLEVFMRAGHVRH